MSPGTFFRTHATWAAALAIVAAGWLGGYLFWSPDHDHPTYFSLADSYSALFVGIPTSVVGALLLTQRSRAARVLGRLVLIGGALLVAFVLSWAFFGICLDPEEACVPSWSSRLLALAAAAASILIGYAVFRGRGGAGPRRSVAEH